MPREVVVPLHALPAPRDALSRPMRDLRISVMDRCNFRCPYCMPRETFHEHYRFLRSQERLSFERSCAWRGCSCSLGVRKLRLTGGEPLLRANLADLIGDLTRHSRRSRTSRSPPTACCWRSTRSSCKAAGLQARHGESRQPRPAGVHAHERRLRRRRGGAGGHRARASRRAHARQGQRRRAARRERSHRARSGGALPRQRRHRALHRVHGRRQPQSLALGPGRAVDASCWRASAHAGRSRRSSRITAARWRGATRFDDGEGEIGFISSVSQPFCGDCTRARLSSDGKFYTCLFATHGVEPARCAARRRQR